MSEADGTSHYVIAWAEKSREPGTSAANLWGKGRELLGDLAELRISKMGEGFSASGILARKKWL